MSRVNKVDQQKTGTLEYAMAGLQAAKTGSEIRANNAMAAKAEATTSEPAAVPEETVEETGQGAGDLSADSRRKAMMRRLGRYT